MKEINLLSWGTYLDDVYVHGAQIDYLPTGHVRYRNPIMSPGTPIYTWRGRKDEVYERRAFLLPFLIPGHEYAFRGQATLVPDDSIGVSVVFLDADGHRIKRHLFSQLSGKFTYPENAASYELSLNTFDNQQVTFDYLAFGEADILDQYEISRRSIPGVNLVFLKPAGSGQMDQVNLLVERPQSIIQPIRWSGPGGTVVIMPQRETIKTKELIADCLVRVRDIVRQEWALTPETAITVTSCAMQYKDFARTIQENLSRQRVYRYIDRK